jgi:threonine dehydratase
MSSYRSPSSFTCSPHDRGTMHLLLSRPCFGVATESSEGDQEKRQIITMLREQGYPVLDMSDNEMAKLHVRYMVGGHTPGLEDELVFRFQFPERPGALLRFLNGLSGGWNISLFHYHNHGADYGWVLAGIQVPAAERAQLRRSLDELGYPYWDVSDNPAYRSFLSGEGMGHDKHSAGSL